MWDTIKLIWFLHQFRKLDKKLIKLTNKREKIRAKQKQLTKKQEACHKSLDELKKC